VKLDAPREQRNRVTARLRCDAWTMVGAIRRSGRLKCRCVRARHESSLEKLEAYVIDDATKRRALGQFTGSTSFLQRCPQRRYSAKPATTKSTKPKKPFELKSAKGKACSMKADEQKSSRQNAQEISSRLHEGGVIFRVSLQRGANSTVSSLFAKARFARDASAPRAELVRPVMNEPLAIVTFV
jgi:hypothetical protein